MTETETPSGPRIFSHQEASLIVALREMLDAEVLGSIRTATASRIGVGLATVTGFRTPAHSPRIVGALLDRMGVPPTGRDYHRDLSALRAALPVWLDAAEALLAQPRTVRRLPTGDTRPPPTPPPAQ